MQNLVLTTLQYDIIWENKNANLKKIENFLTQLKLKSHIVVLPEMFNTGFSNNIKLLAEPMNGETITQMALWSKQYRLILVGSLIVEENNNYYNRLCWFYPNGNIVTYDKKHLFSLAQENNYYTAGNKRLVTSVNGWKIFSIICYDLRFPVWCRQHKANEEYDIIICVANWPRIRTLQWEKLLMARAIENQCYIVGLNRIGLDGNNIEYEGNSLIANPSGELLYQNKNEEQAFTFNFEKEPLDKHRAHFHFGNEADKFLLFP